MAIDQRRRQKKIERKAAKRRAALEQKRAAVGYLTGVPPRDLMEAASQAHIHQCLVASGLFQSGIGHVIFSRRLGNGSIAAAFFLVDVFCLGVKDAFLAFLPHYEFERKKLKLNRGDRVVERPPAYVRKLVEGAVSYAAALGLDPHPDYKLAERIFGDVDASECRDTFVFGVDGKPNFIAGPHDTPAKCQRIVDILQRRLGDNGYHYMIPVELSDLDEHEFLGEED